MTRMDQLSALRRLHEMRVRRSQLAMHQAADQARTCERLADEGVTRHARKQKAADQYFTDHLADINLDSGASIALASLFLGQRNARQEAMVLGARAGRLKDRHKQAKTTRAAKTQAYLSATRRQDQLSETVKLTMRQRDIAADEGQEEEIQDLFAGRARHGTS